MKNILLLNSISPVVNDIFNSEYSLSTDCASPVGIMLRSFKMHDYELDENTIAIARAGAGTNNIPVEKYANEGVVVFNTPGANANAVKELVLSALFLASRNVIEANRWVDTLKGKGEEVGKLVEKGKANFVGNEILGKKLGVVGLGAIGAQVANSAISLGMEVYGYDPFLSVNAALKLSRAVNVVKTLDELVSTCDYLTIHIPYIPAQNKGLFNSEMFAKMKDGVVIINCARGEIVDNVSVLTAIKSGKIKKYVCDFPADELIGEENVLCIPHLGASTNEAEDNCAVMAANQLIEYIENGNIVNSVNYPSCSMPRTTEIRLVILHKNIANIIAQITTAVGKENINIMNMANQSKGEFAVTILDVEKEVSSESIKHLLAVDGIIKIRVVK
jgi:D-3-phosphoglycerate dehydrogenase